MAIAAILYFLFYVKIELFRSYFTAPIDLIFSLYIMRFIPLTLGINRVKKIVILAFILLFLHNTYKFPRLIFSQKNFIHGRAQIAHFLKNYA